MSSLKKFTRDDTRGLIFEIMLLRFSATLYHEVENKIFCGISNHVSIITLQSINCSYNFQLHGRSSVYVSLFFVIHFPNFKNYKFFAYLLYVNFSLASSNKHRETKNGSYFIPSSHHNLIYFSSRTLEGSFVGHSI